MAYSKPVKISELIDQNKMDSKSNNSINMESVYNHSRTQFNVNPALKLRNRSSSSNHGKPEAPKFNMNANDQVTNHLETNNNNNNFTYNVSRTFY